jgi:hypothetical protein
MVRPSETDERHADITQDRRPTGVVRGSRCEGSINRRSHPKAEACRQHVRQQRNRPAAFGLVSHVGDPRRIIDHLQEDGHRSTSSETTDMKLNSATVRDQPHTRATTRAAVRVPQFADRVRLQSAADAGLVWSKAAVRSSCTRTVDRHPGRAPADLPLRCTIPRPSSRACNRPETRPARARYGAAPIERCTRPDGISPGPSRREVHLPRE